MALDFRYPDALREIIANTLATRAGNAALLRIYSGTKPADADAAVGGGTLLAELTMGSPAFASSSSEGVIAANAITDDSSANASGTAAWFRVVQSNGTTPVCDGTVGTSGCDMNLVTVTIVATQPVSISSFTVTVGNA